MLNTWGNRIGQAECSILPGVSRGGMLGKLYQLIQVQFDPNVMEELRI